MTTRIRTRPAPVLLLGFNRPDLLRRNLEAIRAASTRPVFVALDGPRSGNEHDAKACAEAREVCESIDWADDVRLLIRELNLGCGPAVSSAVTWAFEQSDRVIVLEDDCLPDVSFFEYCDELLERYAHDERVMQVGGCNWGAAEERFLGASYGFTSFAPVWGWASWRRAWELYDYELDSWPRVRDGGLLDGLAVSPRFRRLMRAEWDRVRAGEGTWDHQWQYAVMRHHGLSATPSRNLVVNVGFREDATHVSSRDYIFSELPMETARMPLLHPHEVARNPSADALFERIYWRRQGGPKRLYRKIVRSERLRTAVRNLVERVDGRPT